MSDGGTLDVLVPGFTHCKYVALSTNASPRFVIPLTNTKCTEGHVKTYPTLSHFISPHLHYPTTKQLIPAHPLSVPYYPLTNPTPPTLPYTTQPHLPLPETPTIRINPTIYYTPLRWPNRTYLILKPYPNPRHLLYPILPDLHYTSLHHPILP